MERSEKFESVLTQIDQLFQTEEIRKSEVASMGCFFASMAVMEAGYDKDLFMSYCSNMGDEIEREVKKKESNIGTDSK